MTIMTELQYESTEVSEIYTAMVKAQAQMGDVAKDSRNPHFRNTYSSLAALVDAIRAPLTSNGICWTHQSVFVDGQQCIRTKLGHTSGQWLASYVPVDGGKGIGAQAMGSGISYAKRYGLQSLVGIASADEDDDGHQATVASQQRAQKQPPRMPPPPPQQSAQQSTVREMLLMVEAAKNLAELESIRPSKNLTEDEKDTVRNAWRFKKAQLEAQQQDGFGFSVNREPGSDDDRA